MTSLLHQCLLIVSCFVLGLFVASIFDRPSQSPPAHSILRYSPSAPHSCEAPRNVRQRFAVQDPKCIQVNDIDANAIDALIQTSAPSVEVTLSPKVRFVGSAVATSIFNCSKPLCTFSFAAQGLVPDADYVITLTAVNGSRRPSLCHQSLSTRPRSGNFVRNSGFEHAGDAPFMPTRFGRSEVSSPRQWTAFYNGGVRIACGAGKANVHPRSGLCMAEFGYTTFDRVDSGDVQKFYGAHQVIPIRAHDRSDAYTVGAWYRVTPELLNADKFDESPRDSLAMVVSWRFDDGSVDDGVVVPFRLHEDAIKSWTLSCLNFRVANGGRLTHIHVHIHRHDYQSGDLYVDDVFVRAAAEGGRDEVLSKQCHETELIHSKPLLHRTSSLNASSTKFDLVATERPKEKQLTLAVPCTPERVLRLEAMSRLYGGGPVAAAVLVNSEEETRLFVHIWRRKPWLYKHVDVKFVRMSAEARARTPIPINALRNIAVSLAATEFIAMLDVDMTPATDAFSCFRDTDGHYLSQLLPSGSKRLLMLPVFVADQHQRSAKNKQELLNQLGMRRGTTYCLNSQKPLRIARWYTERNPYDVRFKAGFEPYGIGRSENYPIFDERFVGYGFNKISWALGAERSGYELLVSTDAFVTHLNHMENDWVQSINVAHYLNTWRRYFSFVAEVS